MSRPSPAGLADDDPIWQPIDEAQRLIIETPAHTPAGVAVKLLVELDDLDLASDDDQRIALVRRCPRVDARRRPGGLKAALARRRRKIFKRRRASLGT